jgi:hypothetical protein
LLIEGRHVPIMEMNTSKHTQLAWGGIYIIYEEPSHTKRMNNQKQNQKTQKHKLM